MTSATRKVPAASSITGWRARVRSARYSVWPVNGTPGVVDDALLDRRRDHGRELARGTAVDGAIQHREHMARVGRIEAAGRRRCAQRHVNDSQAAGAGASAEPGWYGSSWISLPSRRARSASSAWLPMMTRSAGRLACASARHRSGPMPAGSPAVTAIRCGAGFRACTRRTPRRAAGAARARFLHPPWLRAAPRRHSGG